MCIRDSINLCKLAENQLVMIRRNSASRISNFDLHHASVVIGGCSHPHLTARWSKLECVAEQIHQNVHYFVSIAVNEREVCGNIAIESQLLTRNERLIQLIDLIDNLIQREQRRIDGQRLAGSLRVQKNFRNHVQKLPATGNDRADALTLPLIHVPQQSVAKNFGMRDDRGQRRSQIVRNVREKLRLQRVAIAKFPNSAIQVGELRLQRFSVELSAHRHLQQLRYCRFRSHLQSADDEAATSSVLRQPSTFRAFLLPRCGRPPEQLFD